MQGDSCPKTHGSVASRSRARRLAHPRLTPLARPPKGRRRQRSEATMQGDSVRRPTVRSHPTLVLAGSRTPWLTPLARPPRSLDVSQVSRPSEASKSSSQAAGCRSRSDRVPILKGRTNALSRLVPLSRGTAERSDAGGFHGTWTSRRPDGADEGKGDGRERSDAGGFLSEDPRFGRIPLSCSQARAPPWLTPLARPPRSLDVSQVSRPSEASKSSSQAAGCRSRSDRVPILKGRTRRGGLPLVEHRVRLLRGVRPFLDPAFEEHVHDLADGS